MSGPWFPFTERELAWLRQCKSTRTAVVLCSALMLGCNTRSDAPRVSFDRPLRRADVDELAGCHERHTRLSFQQLELELGIKRTRKRHPKDRYASEFQLDLPLGCRRIGGDPSADGSADGSATPLRRMGDDPSVPPHTPPPDQISETSVRSYARARRVAPSRRIGSGTNERTNEQLLLDPITRLACKHFEVEPATAQRYVDKARAFKLAPTDAELAWWLPVAASNQKVLEADIPLAVALCEWRLRRAIEPQRKAVQRTKVVARDELEQVRDLPRGERLQLAQAALRSLKGGAT